MRVSTISWFWKIWEVLWYFYWLTLKLGLKIFFDNEKSCEEVLTIHYFWHMSDTNNRGKFHDTFHMTFVGILILMNILNWNFEVTIESSKLVIVTICHVHIQNQRIEFTKMKQKLFLLNKKLYSSDCPHYCIAALSFWWTMWYVSEIKSSRNCR